MHPIDSQDRLFAELKYGKLPAKAFTAESWADYSAKLPRDFKKTYGYARFVRTFNMEIILLDEFGSVHGINTDEEEFLERLIADMVDYEKTINDQRID